MKAHQENLDGLDIFSDEEHDVALFISIDESGKQSSFGPSSALHWPVYKHSPFKSRQSQTVEHIRNSLVANAALQRQYEHQVSLLPDIDGVPTELAMHLLDLHWTRQHHTFLLTYRPAIMRDLLNGGPNCSRFLINSIFACTSKFSQRIEVRDEQSDVMSSGRRFFERCDSLLVEESLLIHPTVPTIVGLLLLGSTYNSRGEISKGWLYTGYALRMVYDLGLHIDPRETTDAPEEREIRRRVFWGAFICDKLQSLYLGRPVAINLRDCHVSLDFFDTFEEKELYLSYIDPEYPPAAKASMHYPAPIYSVSTFQQFCLLSNIMARIIDQFYVVGAIFSNAPASLELIDTALKSWKQNVPKELDFQILKLQNNLTQYPPPNIMNLHCIYHSLIILLHRPFISDGHLRSADRSTGSWESCTGAAQSITNIAVAYETAYGLDCAPYILSYTIYVACTIHVRNAAAADVSQGRKSLSLLSTSLQCLNKLCIANPGVTKPVNIIRKLMMAAKIAPSRGRYHEIMKTVIFAELLSLMDIYRRNDAI